MFEEALAGYEQAAPATCRAWHVLGSSPGRSGAGANSAAPGTAFRCIHPAQGGFRVLCPAWAPDGPSPRSNSCREKWRELRGISMRPATCFHRRWRCWRIGRRWRPSPDTSCFRSVCHKVIWPAPMRCWHWRSRQRKSLNLAPLLGDLLHARAQLRMAQGDRARALADLRAAVEQVDRVRGSLQADRFRAAFLGNRAALYEDLVDGLLESAQPEAVVEAWTVAERAKSRSLLDLVSGAIDLAARARAVSDDPREAGLPSTVEPGARRTQCPVQSNRRVGTRRSTPCSRCGLARAP